MQTAVLLVFPFLVILLVNAPATAQSHLPSEMLCEGCDEINSTGAYTATAALPVSLPDPPAPRPRVIDKKFVAVMGALAGAESLRFTTHKLVLDHEYAAGAPWVHSVPANQSQIAKYAPIYAAELLVAYELKKPHSWLPGDRIVRKLWWAYAAVAAPINTKNGVRSIRTQDPPCSATGC